VSSIFLSDLMDRNAARLKAVIFIEGQLENVAARTGTRIGDQTAPHVMTAAREGQHDLEHGPIRVQ
jgi:hypothetical protein